MSLEVTVLPDGGSPVTDSFSLPNIANSDGANVTGGDAFAEATINRSTFEGSAGQALYGSQNSVIIPEPSAPALLGLGLRLVSGSCRR